MSLAMSHDQWRRKQSIAIKSSQALVGSFWLVFLLPGPIKLVFMKTELASTQVTSSCFKRHYSLFIILQDAWVLLKRVTQVKKIKKKKTIQKYPKIQRQLYTSDLIVFQTTLFFIYHITRCVGVTKTSNAGQKN